MMVAGTAFGAAEFAVTMMTGAVVTAFFCIRSLLLNFVVVFQPSLLDGGVFRFGCRKSGAC